MATGKHATPKQRFEISIELNKHCSTDAEGYAVYADGENDNTIAKRVGAPVSAVAATRQQVFGRMAPRGKKPDRLSALEERVADLERLVERYTAPRPTAQLVSR